MSASPMRRAEISVSAIRHNVRRIRALTGGTVIAVVKADGYGHGADIAARAALEGGASLLGVTDIDEALKLRAAGVEAPILCWLHGSRADFDAAVMQRIEIGVSLPSQLEAIAVAAERAGVMATIQFKIDTGLSRNGSPTSQWAQLFARGAQLQNEGRVLIRGIFSHLANAGEREDLAQARRFDEALAVARAEGLDPELIHIAASAAVFTSPHLHYNTVRVGVAIYGLSPCDNASSVDLGLIPAMTLKSEVVMVRSVPAGTGVSYGFTHTVETETTLALVPVGYADGLPRGLSGRGVSIEIAGQQAPIVGRIGMDQCIVEVGAAGPPIAIGDPVTLFGDPQLGVPSIDSWAHDMGTINYEIAVGIGARVERVAVDLADTTHDAAMTQEPGRSHNAEPSHTADTWPEANRPVPATGATAVIATADEASAPENSPARIWKLEASDPEAMHRFGYALGAQLAAGDLVILTGTLGAGKTTLTRGIGEGLGVRGPITSPTFVLARTHPSLGAGPPLVHVDAYRLANPAEADDLDLDFEGSVVVAEWGAGLIAESGSWLEITIARPEGAAGEIDPTISPDEELVEPRSMVIAGYGPRWANVELPI